MHQLNPNSDSDDDSGGVAGYKQYDKIKNGSSGTEIKLYEYKYYKL